jgi:hypothetical protein
MDCFQNGSPLFRIFWGERIISITITRPDLSIFAMNLGVSALITSNLIRYTNGFFLRRYYARSATVTSPFNRDFPLAPIF